MHIVTVDFLQMSHESGTQQRSEGTQDFQELQSFCPQFTIIIQIQKLKPNKYSFKLYEHLLTRHNPSQSMPCSSLLRQLFVLVYKNCQIF